ncbi:MAG: TlpA disulfide reductase family protein [Bacteroidetes bacterium]|nr:TlpA disulfide reductase family protein [Bacteroidota bacterium]
MTPRASHFPHFGTLPTLLIAALLAMFSACESAPAPQGPAGTISGTIDGVESGAEVLLRSFKNGNLVNVANTTVDSTGSFVLTPSEPLRRGYHQLLVGRKYPLVLITDSTEAIHVEAQTVEGMKYLVGAEIVGSEDSRIMATYYDHIMPLQQRMMSTERKTNMGDATERQAAADLLQAMKDSLVETSVTFVEAHSQSLMALSALESLDAENHKELFGQVLANLKDVAGDSHYYSIIKSKFDVANRPRRLDMNAGNSQQRQAKNGRYIQGDMAPDIVMNDPNGQTRKLSDLKGKVVLLDFWASWCGPCRRENPNVVRAYEKYKDRGFEVFSVSLDSDAGKWQRAIEQDQLTWPNHVCDMRGWRNEAAQAYGISSIPHTMLIDRDGSVLATHLRGAMLESALRGVLGE